MTKKILVVAVAVIFLISLSGCATVRKQQDLKIQGLKNQISVLEAQVQSKDEELANLKESLAKSQAEGIEQAGIAGKKRVIPEAKKRPTTKQIQIALKNAGYDPGVIDGRMGRQTRVAIKAFQAANNLTSDGKAGKMTWGLLQQYLYKKVK